MFKNHQIRSAYPGYPRCVLAAALLLFFTSAYANPPSSYVAEYEARIGGFRANAERSLQIAESGLVELTSSIKLKLLGTTLSTITEQSTLSTDINNEQLKPESYSFIQTGLGKRKRQINFDWDAGSASTDDGKNENDITLQDNAVDNLSSYLAMRDQLINGNMEIVFPIVEKGTIRDLSFRVVGEESISTSLGTFNTVRLERIREEGSDRTTELWLAPDWDYLLIKMLQKEEGERDISLELKQATVGDELVLEEI